MSRAGGRATLLSTAMSRTVPPLRLSVNAVASMWAACAWVQGAAATVPAGVLRRGHRRWVAWARRGMVVHYSRHGLGVVVDTRPDACSRFGTSPGDVLSVHMVDPAGDGVVRRTCRVLGVAANTARSWLLRPAVAALHKRLCPVANHHGSAAQRS